MEYILRFVLRAVIRESVRTDRGFIFFGLLIGGIGAITAPSACNAPFSAVLLGLFAGICMLVLWVRIVYSWFLESLK